MLIPLPTEPSPDAEHLAHEREYRTLFNRFLLAAIVSIPVLITSYPQFVPGLRDASPETLRLIWAVDAVLTVPVLLYAGQRFFVGAWRALQHRAADMNTLIALSTGAAWLYSVVAVVVPSIFPPGTGEPFIDVVAVVIALVVLGQALETRARGRTSEAIKKLLNLQARTARFIAWFDFGPQARIVYALVTSVSVLIIACPCALGLAAAMSLMVGMGKAAEHGVLIRNGAALQVARDVDTVVLDKTGTITVGKPALPDVHATDGLDEARVLRLAVAVEKGSEHPLGEAIVRGAEERGMVVPNAEQFRAIPGRGVEAKVHGQTVLLGNAQLMEDRHLSLAGTGEEAKRLADEGKTPMYVAVADRVVGVIAVADTIKPDSVAAIRTLKGLGLDVVMLTGDNRRTADAIAREVGITRGLAEVLPDEKVRQVRQLQAEGWKVVMVGDGINDAPALAQADLGVAIEASDVTLIPGSLHGGVTAIEISHATMRNIKQNLFGSFIYNTLGVPIAAGVLYLFFGILLSPMIGGAAMAASSVTVVTNVNRLRRWRLRMEA